MKHIRILLDPAEEATQPAISSSEEQWSSRAFGTTLATGTGVHLVVLLIHHLPDSNINFANPGTDLLRLILFIILQGMFVLFWTLIPSIVLIAVCALFHHHSPDRLALLRVFALLLGIAMQYGMWHVSSPFLDFVVLSEDERYGYEGFYKRLLMLELLGPLMVTVALVPGMLIGTSRQRRKE